MSSRRFYREYQDVIDGRNVVDFAALLQRAAQVSTDGEPLLDHLLVDDYQDTTLAAEAIVARAGARPTSSWPATPRRTSSRSRGDRHPDPPVRRAVRRRAT
mgnify:CR=1 FL=1